jgi:hypothetical protein
MWLRTDGFLSAILKLRMVYLSEAPASVSPEGILQAHDSIREVLGKTLEHFQRFRNGWGDLSRYPPHALDWLYRVAVAVVYLAHDSDTLQYDKEIGELKFALDHVSQRWQAAGECSLTDDQDRPLTLGAVTQLTTQVF